MQLSSQSQDDGLHLQAHHSGWTTSIFCGEIAQAQAHVTEGRRLYDPNRHASHRYIYGGHDPGCCARYTAGQVEWLLGYPDRAAAAVSEAISLADYIAHPFTREVAIEYAAQNIRVEKVLIQLGLDPSNITFEAFLNRLVDIILANINIANTLALVGAILYVATLMVRTIVPLRILGIISMLFFIGYGALAGAGSRWHEAARVRAENRSETTTRMLSLMATGRTARSSSGPRR